MCVFRVESVLTLVPVTTVYMGVHDVGERADERLSGQSPHPVQPWGCWRGVRVCGVCQPVFYLCVTQASCTHLSD